MTENIDIDTDQFDELFQGVDKEQGEQTNSESTPVISNEELERLAKEAKFTDVSLGELNKGAEGGVPGEQVRKKRKYTKRKKDPNAPKKPRKQRKTKKSKEEEAAQAGESRTVSGGGVSREMSREASEEGTGISSPLKTSPLRASPLAKSPSFHDAPIGSASPVLSLQDHHVTLNIPPNLQPPVPERRMASELDLQRLLAYRRALEQRQPEPERPQPLNEDGVPIDMVKAMEYLQEPFKEYERVSLSEKLLSKKKEEDEGVETDNDEGEEFEDLLEIFDIDPDEVSLDLGLNDRRNLLLESMDDNQLSRYEFFRRTNLNTGNIRKFVNNVVGQNVNSNLAKIIGGVGKMFVGEIVEKAKDVQLSENHARVIEQLHYKRTLKKYENELQRRKTEGESTEGLEKPPPPPTFYDNLRESANYPKRSSYTYNNFRVIIPDESTQLTPDHIRSAWKLYHDENKTVIDGRWRQQGGGNGLLFR
ncbi:DEKNAAC104225 [Brettanomyces naardenensis]|uniref:DEKNAAC104225 n=1 Tax=Brettanomyces naardenensis TaxID=13370 RepID=A0A448YPV8_BRENA|nr:DEKNAAC104225 [Brettanomyces naardenensis]